MAGNRGNTASSADIDRAIEIAVRGFCVHRSATHPYLARRQGRIWELRDPPRRTKDHYRVEEWLAHGVSPEQLHRIARRGAMGPYRICFMRASDKPDGPIRETFKRLGYRLRTTEPLMVHQLKSIPRFDSPVRIERVKTTAMARRLGKAMRRKPLSRELLAPDAPIRQYVALDGKGLPVGWTRSIVAGNGTYVVDVYVKRSHRRRGIARAMLAQMLRDDRASGAKLSVLLASHTGALMYPIVGYEPIAELMVYNPPRTSKALRAHSYFVSVVAPLFTSKV